MFPTEKATENGLSIKLTDNTLVINDRKFMGNKIFDVGWESSHLAYRPQHLYIVNTQATIEVGDWVIVTNGKRTEVHQTSYKDYHLEELESGVVYKGVKKHIVEQVN